MKRGSKFALAALALSLVPFELNPGKDGVFSYQSLLVGVSSRKNEEGKRNLVLNLFNLPDFLKKKPAEKAEEAQTEDSSEIVSEVSTAQMPDALQEEPEIPTEPAL